MKKIFISLMITFITSTQAMAFCMPPSTPASYKPSKPVAPFCVNEWAGTHTCDQMTIDWYIRDIEHYNREVEDYINRLKDFVDSSVEYANCEARELTN